MKEKRCGIALFGGSFNPLHVGHLRLAIEIAEEESLALAKVVLLPSYRPPHKQAKGMLPFALRTELLCGATDTLARVCVSTMEAEREGLSYTFETLSAWQKRYSGPLFFILGSDDYAELGSWFRGLELIHLATLLVVPRGSYGASSFEAQTFKHWPNAQMHSTQSATVPSAGRVQFLPIRWFNVSATEVRRRFVQGLEIAALVPDSVRSVLLEQQEFVRSIWQEEEHDAGKNNGSKGYACG